MLRIYKTFSDEVSPTQNVLEALSEEALNENPTSNVLESISDEQVGLNRNPTVNVLESFFDNDPLGDNEIDHTKN